MQTDQKRAEELVANLQVPGEYIVFDLAGNIVGYYPDQASAEKYAKRYSQQTGESYQAGLAGTNR